MLGVLACLLASMAAEEILVLQVRVLAGEGAIHKAGSRSSQALSIQVSDETGKPVQGATVSFRLPEEGPTGLFRNGLRTHVAVTDASGAAAVKGVRWNQIEGQCPLRVIVAKDRARAGIIVHQYVSGR
jgi:hypothetical protein